MNNAPQLPGNRGPKNNRYFNIYANNAQSYLNGLRAMKGSAHINAGRRMQFKIPGMKMGTNMSNVKGIRRS
jgi:hypothetical protein